MKALLKRLKIANNSKIDNSKYYDFSQLAYQKSAEDPQSFSPLFKDNIKLECNSDDAVLHAFQELLLETYDPLKLQDLNIKKTDKFIDSEAMRKDKEQISSKLKTCKEKSDRFPFFEIRDLSTANWYQNIV